MNKFSTILHNSFFHKPFLNLVRSIGRFSSVHSELLQLAYKPVACFEIQINRHISA